VQYNKQDMKHAKRVLDATKPHEELKLELVREYIANGDKDGDIHRRIELVDGIWRHFIIAVDNAKE
jgi:hypothetical protein